MANLTNNHYKNSSSKTKYYATKKAGVAPRANIQASAYSVDAMTGDLKGFHYSTCGAGGTCTRLCLYP